MGSDVCASQGSPQSVEPKEEKREDGRSIKILKRWNPLEPVSYTHLDVYKRQHTDEGHTT